jgi:ABC-type branched-subunit amino acid transport system permease subunit
LSLAALIGVTSLFGNDYYLRIAFMMCVYYLCAAGMNVLVGYAGQKSLGQAGLFAAGAYAVALLTTRTELSPWLALVAAAGISAACGVLIALPSLRVKGPYLAMVTLAFGIVVEKLVGEWTEVFGGAQGIYGIKSLSWNGQPLSALQWVWFAVVLCAVTHLLLRNLLLGRFGRALLSLQADEIASSSVGVRVYRAKVMAFVVAAVTCGIAGALVAQQNQYINSDFITFHLSIFILLLVLFGGAGSMYGPLVGAVLLTLIDAFLARWPRRSTSCTASCSSFALLRDAGRRCRPVREVVQAAEGSSPERGHQAADTIGIPGTGELLTVQGREQVIRRREAGAGRVLQAPARSHPCPDRPERRRQEHDDQHGDRRGRSRFGLDPIPEAGGHRRPPGAHDLLPGHGAHVPETCACSPDLSRARQRDAGAAQPHEERLLRSLFACRAREEERITANADADSGPGGGTRRSWNAGRPSLWPATPGELARALATSRSCCCSTNLPRLESQETASSAAAVRIGKCGVERS